MPNEPTIRRATVDDIPALMRNRRLMAEEQWAVEGHAVDPAGFDATGAATACYLRAQLDAGQAGAWLADAHGDAVSSAIISILSVPPRYGDPSGRIAYVYGVYTAPAYRRRGLARRIMELAVEWAREQGIRCVELGASKAGRPLYESLGFRPDRHMSLWLS